MICESKHWAPLAHGKPVRCDEGQGQQAELPRSSLTDEHTLEALLAREAEDVVGDAMCRFEGVPRLGFAATEQLLEW